MSPYDDLFQKYSLLTGVPKTVIEAVARTESSLNPNAVGDHGNSVGLFQMYRPTATRYGITDLDTLKDPEIATDTATRYMNDIIQRQGGLNLPDFYSEYNSGRKGLWKTSSEVFGHVQNFMANYAVALGTAFDTAAVLLLVVGLALVARYFRRI